ncbi:MAG: class I adenylate-forming enzyme family protein, partial [Bacilli bacterium]|nr:class I adenylate-forming enzyme family protein [Bacilli bacterium]
EINPKAIVCLDSCVPDLDEIITNNKDIDESIERILYYSPIDSLKKKGILSLINPIIDSKYKKSGLGPKSLDTTSSKFASFHDERAKAKNYQGSYMTDVKGEDDYVIYYSSGTSGNKPSGAIHTNNSCNSLLKSGQYICDCIEPGQKLIIVPGPFHCFGSETGRNTLVNSGVTQLIIPNPKDLKALAETQKKEQAEIHIYVPLIMSKMKDSGMFDDISYENTELFISGGGKLSNSTSTYWNKKLPPGRGVREGYGSTQTNGGICINLKHKQIPGTLGIPLPDCYFKIKDLETEEVINKPNKAGELYIAAPSLMRAVLNEPNSPVLSVDDEGVTWYKTSDIVTYDENGWYRFVERNDDVLNLDSGNLVNPSEIKNVLEKYNIENSIIFNTNGHEKSQGKDRVILCIEYAGDNHDIELLKEVLEKEFALHLKSYEIPSEVIVFSQLPINLNGKFLKKETMKNYFNDDYKLKLVLKK